MTELNTSNRAFVREFHENYGFADSFGILDDGTHVWVTNSLENSVTEINASDGSLARTIEGSNYGFNGPIAITVYGPHVWVANLGIVTNGSVTEINASDGSLVRLLSASTYGFGGPTGIAASNGKIWVGDSSSVTEINANDGNFMRKLSGISANEVTAAGSHVWSVGYTDDSVTEIDAVSGKCCEPAAKGTTSIPIRNRRTWRTCMDHQ